MNNKIKIEKEKEKLKNLKTRSFSFCDLQELQKRKRDLMENKEDVEIFRKSKKTTRSPMKGEREKEETADEEEKEKESLREMLKCWKDEIMEGIKEQGKMTRYEMEKMRKEIGEIKERVEKWNKEKEEMSDRVEKLEGRIKMLEEQKKVSRGKEEEDGGRENIDNRIKIMERRMEMKEREDRKKNFIIKGLEVKDGKRSEAVEDLLERIGVKVGIKEAKRIGKNLEKEGEMVWVRLENEGQRKEIWERKSILKGRKERLLEDWTWKERQMRWKLVQLAKEEEREGR